MLLTPPDNVPTDMIDLLKTLPNCRDKGADWFEAKNYYPWLAWLASELRPRSILEIGVRLGYSAISFLEGAKSELYVGLDCEQYIGKSNSSASQNLEHYRSNSKSVFEFELHTVDTQALKDIDFLNGRTFDLVHVDGDHSQVGAFKDMSNFWCAVSVGGVMVVDDSLFLPQVRRAIEAFLKEHDVPNCNVPTYRGSWVIQRVG